MKKALIITLKIFAWILIVPLYMIKDFFALLATFRWTVFYGVGLIIPFIIIALYVLPIVFRKKIKGGVTAGVFYATVFTLIMSIGLYFASYFIGVVRPVFGFNRNDFTIVYQEDSHGGFHGDGTYCLVLDCSDNREDALQNVEDWNKLPLPKELEVVAFGGRCGDVSYYRGMFPDEVSIPPITNGYYYFKDRHSESTDRDNPTGLIERYSYNFDFAIYDADTDMLYCIRHDT